MQGRSFVTPQDIKDVAPDVLRHRLIVTYEAEAENIASDQVIQKSSTRFPFPNLADYFKCSKPVKKMSELRPRIYTGNSAKSGAIEIVRTAWFQKY